MCQEDEEGVIIGGYMRQGGKYSREREIGCVRVKDFCEYEDEKKMNTLEVSVFLLVKASFLLHSFYL